ncbi:MAG: flagellar hook-basal body complex protein FliE [Oricola sp.]|jgi:flagellar hook-basal body complex protein FliE|nr:flagellar hook-basal body complex protein FliE [Oricola sp.]
MVDPISSAAALAPAQVQKTAFAKPAAPVAGPSFAETLKAAAASTVDSLKTSEATSMSAMQGGAAIQDVVGATVRAELAVETAVSVRNKLIESYQEIMRMPI